MTNVRPAVLRRYYESTYGLEEIDGPRPYYADATAEEFFQLARLRHYGYSESALARLAPPELDLGDRSQLDTTPTGGRVVSVPGTLVAKQPMVDLATVALDPGTTSLALDAVRSVVGWDRLAERGLHRLSLTTCRSAEPFSGLPAEIDNLQVMFCDAGCVASALAAVVPAMLVVEHDFRLHQPELVPDRLRLLSVRSPLVSAPANLATARLESLSIANTRADDRFWQTVSGSADTLRQLVLGSLTPFGPQRLAMFGKLDQLEIVGYPEVREPWIDWAVAHPRVECIFREIGHWQFARPMILAELYHDVSILRCGTQARPRFEIAEDLVGLLDLDLDDNGVLEDLLKPLARKAKRKVRWGSEADTLVADAADVDTCRWIVDRAATFNGSRRAHVSA